MTSTSTAQNPRPADAASDDAVFAALESGFQDTLPIILDSFVGISDPACARLEDCIACAFWQEAVRLALKIGQEAERLGFTQIEAAARSFAYAAYHADTRDNLKHEGTVVVVEYHRIRLALMARYRDFLAPGTASVA
jgi:hypothetical protein